MSSHARRAGGAPGGAPVDELTLLDWRRRVASLYGEVRAARDPGEAWLRWRTARDELLATHPQSPLLPEARDGFGGLRYYDYDPAARVLAEVAAVEPSDAEIATSTGGALRFRRFAVVRFALAGRECELELYWLAGYAGGVFLPFADETSGAETYASGRYLLDTAKGADLGAEDGRLVLDWNYAYNPSCAYDRRWACPLVPPANRLSLPVRAGERL